MQLHQLFLTTIICMFSIGIQAQTQRTSTISDINIPRREAHFAHERPDRNRETIHVRLRHYGDLGMRLSPEDRKRVREIIIIPSTVTALGSKAFYHCDEMKEMTFLSTVLPSMVKPNDNPKKLTIVVPQGSESAYSSLEAFKKFKVLAR